MEDGQYVPGSLWFYAPSKGAPIAFAILFTLSGSLHFAQSTHHHSWRITWIYAWSSLLFISGYILRALGAWHPSDLPIFISSTVLLYAAPPVYELGNYLVLSRCLHYIPHLSPIHPDRTLTLFLGASAVVESLTASGASNSITAPDPAPGKALLKTALVLQIGVMALQIGIAARYHARVRGSGVLEKNTAAADVQAVLVTLYASCALITVRTIYRTVEYFAVASLRPPWRDVDDISPMVRYEWFFWVFEASLMLVNSVLLNWRHPGKYLPKRLDVFLTPEGTERVGVEFKDRRPVWRKVVDPLDFYGLVLGRDEKWWLDGGEMVERAERVEVEGVGKKDGRSV